MGWHWREKEAVPNEPEIWRLDIPQSHNNQANICRSLILGSLPPVAGSMTSGEAPGLHHSPIYHSHQIITSDHSALLAKSSPAQRLSKTQSEELHGRSSCGWFQHAGNLARRLPYMTWIFQRMMFPVLQVCIPSKRQKKKKSMHLPVDINMREGQLFRHVLRNPILSTRFYLFLLDANWQEELGLQQIKLQVKGH